MDRLPQPSDRNNRRRASLRRGDLVASPGQVSPSILGNDHRSGYTGTRPGEPVCIPATEVEALRLSCASPCAPRSSQVEGEPAETVQVWGTEEAQVRIRQGLQVAARTALRLERDTNSH